MRKINDLIVHCAATYDTMDIGVKEIRKVHVDENGWKDIGYHFVIRRDGTVEKGRDVSVIGAPCAQSQRELHWDLFGRWPEQEGRQDR